MNRDRTEGSALFFEFLDFLHTFFFLLTWALTYGRYRKSSVLKLRGEMVRGDQPTHKPPKFPKSPPTLGYIAAQAQLQDKSGGN